MREIKYLIVTLKNMDGDLKLMSAKAVIFNGCISHISISEGIEKDGYEVVSAGFCSFNSITDIKCFGRSDSLNIGSIPEFDRIVIMSTINQLHII